MEMKWQPIATAPKKWGGEVLLLNTFEDIIHAYWHYCDCGNCKPEDGDWTLASHVDLGDLLPQAELTHWMPIPESPKEQK